MQGLMQDWPLTLNRIIEHATKYPSALGPTRASPWSRRVCCDRARASH